jgi:hypothetical protein
MGTSDELPQPHEVIRVSSEDIYDLDEPERSDDPATLRVAQALKRFDETLEELARSLEYLSPDARSGVERAFLTILERRYPGARWSIVGPLEGGEGEAPPPTREVERDASAPDD